MYSFWAMYSLRMSFCIVPDSVAQSAPCCSATTRYIAKIIGAGELIVIDVVTSPSGMPRRALHVGQRGDADAALAHLAQRQRMVGVAPHQRRQVERDAQPGSAGVPAAAGSARWCLPASRNRRTGASSRACPIAGGMNAAGVRKLLPGSAISRA